MDNGRTGLLRPADPDSPGIALLEFAPGPGRHARLGAAAVDAARAPGWDRALGQLAAGYPTVLGAERMHESVRRAGQQSVRSAPRSSGVSLGDNDTAGREHR